MPPFVMRSSRHYVGRQASAQFGESSGETRSPAAMHPQNKNAPTAFWTSIDVFVAEARRGTRTRTPPGGRVGSRLPKGASDLPID